MAGFHRVEGCVRYEAEMATLSLACCSPGSEVTAAWKSAECCWANCFISMATLFWVSVEKRQKKSLRMTEKHSRLMTYRATIQRSADRSNVQGLTEGKTFNRVFQLYCFLFFNNFRCTDALNPKSLGIQFSL